MSYKLAIFDLDGTILDTLDDLADSTNYALEACGFPCRTKAEIRLFVGNGIRNLIERAVPMGTDCEAVNKVFDIFKAHYKTNCNNKTRPYNGVVDMLRLLRQKGCKTAVLSNKADEPVKALCELYFKGLFDYVAGEKTGVPRKPAPDAVYSVLAHFLVEGTDSVYIGDSDVDVDTAKNSQLDFIGVDWGFREREELIARGAEKIAHTTDELTSFILE